AERRRDEARGVDERRLGRGVETRVREHEDRLHDDEEQRREDERAERRERYVAARVLGLARGDRRDLESLEREESEVDALSRAREPVRERAAQSAWVRREDRDADEAEDREDLRDDDEADEHRAGLYADVVDGAEREDRERDDRLVRERRMDAD